MRIAATRPRTHCRSVSRWMLLALLLCTGAVQAQTDDATLDPPERVARLSYLAGDVGFLPSGASAWSAASINRPLTVGDRLSTGDGARAELELDGTTLRIDDATDFGLLDLTNQVAQIELSQGTLDVSVRRLEAGQSVEIDTPTVAVVVDRPGDFRIDAGSTTQPTRVSVRAGSATVYGENNAQRTVLAGRRYVFADSALANVEISDLAGGDDFDAWSADREQRYARSTSSEYVSDEVIGYQDLDQYGSWQDDTQYGAVWYPRSVAVDWAPYRDGHWAYIAPWGWTWVDDAAWGFAPYHYGRWAHVHGRWGWVPGPRRLRAVYAPALVAFVGGGGWSVGIGSGPVGWFPLGPGEIYDPWYRVSRNYYTRINITNIHVRGGRDHAWRDRDWKQRYDRYRYAPPVRAASYANRHVAGAMTAVSGRAFANGRPVRGNEQRVDRRQLANAAVLSHGIAARPAGGVSVLPRGANVRALPTAGFNREVVARRAPPATVVDHAHPVAGPRTTPRLATTSSHVRVLEDRLDVRRASFDRDRAPQQASVELGRQRPAGEARPIPARDVRPMPAQRTATAPSRTATLPAATPIRAVDMRAGELPSARFARGRRGMPAAEARATDTGRMADTDARPFVRGNDARAPRPGLSVISSADTDRAARAAALGTPAAQTSLPTVPRISRADDNPVATPRAVPSREWNDRAYQVRREPPSASPREAERTPAFRAAPRPSQPMPPQARDMAPRSYTPPPHPAYVPRPAAGTPPPAQVAPPVRGAQNAPARRDDHPHKATRWQEQQ